MPRCSHPTRKGLPCPIWADRTNNGQPVCHVHDENGRYREQTKADMQVIISWLRVFERGDEALIPRSSIRKALGLPKDAHADEVLAKIKLAVADKRHLLPPDIVLWLDRAEWV